MHLTGSSDGTTAGGTNIADTTCTMCTLFLRKMALLVMFHTTIQTCLLPAVSIV